MLALGGCSYRDRWTRFEVPFSAASHHPAITLLTGPRDSDRSCRCCFIHMTNGRPETPALQTVPPVAASLAAAIGEATRILDAQELKRIHFRGLPS